MSKQQVTVKDLARKLRISVSTVSRALRNLPDVNPETKQAVQELARQLNYEPNYIAQSLINRKSRIIGVIVPVISAPVFGRILTGMHDAAHQHGYQLMLCQSNESSESEMDLVRQLISFKADGLLVSVSSQTQNAAAFEVLKHKDIPVVFFDRVPPGEDICKVVVDEYHSAFMAVEHLIRSGCRSVAHIAGPPNLSISLDRLNGYLAALDKHGMKVPEKYVVHCEHFEENAPAVIRKWFARAPYPDGIFAINDASAVAAIRYIKTKGLDIPGKVAVIGFNNDPISEIVEPSLTTVMQPGYEMGCIAVQMLISRIENRNLSPETIMLRSRLIKRESSHRHFPTPA